MKSEILSFLNELSETEGRKILELIRNKDTKLKFKTENVKKIETAQLAISPLPNKFFLLPRTDFKKPESEVAFKIPIGTDVYFFKTLIHQEGKYFYIKLPFPIYKLIRRRDTRYMIPKNWAQSGAITSSEKKIFASKVELLELSMSGIKVHAYNELPRYEKLQKIKLAFKIHRRAEMQLFGLIRHVAFPKSGGQTLGIEFFIEGKLMENKIQNICDDLAYSLA